MDDMEELKSLLGSAAQDYNETQLRYLSGELDLAAEFLLDLYAYRRSAQPRKPASLHLTEAGCDVG